MATDRIASVAPFDVIAWADSHATDWTEVTFDRWVKKIGINNRGNDVIYVGARLTGVFSASDHFAEVQPGQVMDFYPGSYRALSIYGADGAGHAMSFVLEGGG